MPLDPVLAETIQECKHLSLRRNRAFRLSKFALASANRRNSGNDKGSIDSRCWNCSVAFEPAKRSGVQLKRRTMSSKQAILTAVQAMADDATAEEILCRLADLVGAKGDAATGQGHALADRRVTGRTGGHGTRPALERRDRTPW